MTFLKNDPRPCATLKTSVFGPFSGGGGPFWSSENPKNALKMGCFGTKNGSKMGQKRIFPNLILDHLGCTNG